MMSSTVVEVTDSTFDVEVTSADKPVLVDFWAPWCGPCRVMSPIMEDLAAKHGDKIKFAKINVDENQATAAKHEVLSIPTFIVFQGGNEAHKIVGAMPSEKVEAELARWL